MSPIQHKKTYRKRQNNISTLQRFLDTIFYTCGMSFHNMCDLTMAILHKQLDDTENDDEEEFDNDKKEPKKEELEKKKPEKEEDTIHKYFQESLLTIHDLVHHRSKSYTTQLVSFQMFASNVEIPMLLK
ncbi:hypothetical protein RclHR1_07230004 [Rhizophagus clarus]|uniref:Uncharacterized protein n=1 Tax=Rhizophagus clarus TaxID=94130 RepID=A0A2Z6SKJ8_9GLOM|nr:hypothetical protein RclHR1_07230004 [Rhizophagus clarus]GES85897.1 hypothetical protein GLOIN_2v323978 [Rhizophagus clarus]